MRLSGRVVLLAKSPLERATCGEHILLSLRQKYRDFLKTQVGRFNNFIKEILLPSAFLRINTKSEQGEGVVPRPARSPKYGH